MSDSDSLCHSDDQYHNHMSYSGDSNAVGEKISGDGNYDQDAAQKQSDRQSR